MTRWQIVRVRDWTYQLVERGRIQRHPPTRPWPARSHTPQEGSFWRLGPLEIRRWR